MWSSGPLFYTPPCSFPGCLQDPRSPVQGISKLDCTALWGGCCRDLEPYTKLTLAFVGGAIHDRASGCGVYLQDVLLFCCRFSWLMSVSLPGLCSLPCREGFPIVKQTFCCSFCSLSSHSASLYLAANSSRAATEPWRDCSLRYAWGFNLQVKAGRFGRGWTAPGCQKVLVAWMVHPPGW